MEDWGSVYGAWEKVLPLVCQQIEGELAAFNASVKREEGDGIYEHILTRIKSEESMREKCRIRNLPESPESALGEIQDAIGLRVVTRFIDDIYAIVGFLEGLEGVRLVRKKDYIRHAKPNGYRSLHVILERQVPFPDFRGENPGRYFIEVQLRTIAMDSWASLEHQLKYKKQVREAALIVSELKRCADELASCDLSMQTIRNLMREMPREEEKSC